MNKKKVLLSVLALILVCALSVTGTLALMKMNTTTPVTNTFIAAGGGELAEGMTLTEHLVAPDANGDYSYAALNADDVPEKVANAEDADEVFTNSYTVMPGMTLPKDPTITITGKTEAPAYLYVEVVGALNGAYQWEMAEGWTEIVGLTGVNGGKVYHYNTILTNAANEPTSFPIIKDDVITIPDDPTVNLNTQEATLTFYAYLAQANAGDNTQKGAYEACFKTVAPNP